MCCSHADYSVEKEYADGLAKNTAAQKSQNAKDNILKFYSGNKVICDKAYQYYKEYETNISKFVKEPIHLTADEFLQRLKDKKMLVLTANPIELGVLVRWLSEKNGSPLETYMVGGYAYNIYNGVNNNSTAPKEYSIIHVNPGMTGDDSTRRVINSTCKMFQPESIVSLGICYGFDYEKYCIGHVFLSESLTVFRVNFRDSEGDTIKLEPETEFDKQPAYKLVRSIRERIMYIMAQNFLSDDEEPVYAKMRLGKFLSTNSLMSNKNAKRTLVEQYCITKPVPLGGEMEGPGILKSDIVQEKDYSNWLVVKSICDWGEAKNELDPDKEKSEQIKDSLQAFAMTNTCSVFDKILSELCEVQYE